MRSGSLLRAMLAGAGVALAALLVFLLLHHRGEAPAPQQSGFDPAAFVRSRTALDAPYLTTDLEVVDAMLGLARVRPDDFVVDLGSGDGRILIAAARSLGARGLGVDIDPARIRESNANARAAGVTGRVAFRRQDLFDTPLAEADVLTLYLTQEVNLRLRPRILAEMRPGTRVVSHDFDMGEWHWDQRQRVGTATVYLWTVPARVAGNWTLSDEGGPIPLTLAQNYQQVTGSAGTARVEQGRLDGDRLRFVAHVGGRRRIYEGRIDGNRIVPASPGASWHAERVG